MRCHYCVALRLCPQFAMAEPYESSAMLELYQARNEVHRERSLSPRVCTSSSDTEEDWSERW